MRIIGGEYRSRFLITPRGNETRPTLDATKESLFNILQGKLEDVTVLDLFAGSGALGLEALSRGAKCAVFCDNSKEAAKALRRNIESLGLENKTEFLLRDWSAALDHLAQDKKKFHIIFLDPPYMAAYEPVIKKIERINLLDSDGLIILERSKKQLVSLPPHFSIQRTRDYRHTAIDFIIRRQEEPDENSDLSGQF